MRRILPIVIVLVLTALSFGQYTTDDITYDNVSNPDMLANLLRDLFDNYEGTSVLFDPQSSAPTASEGKVYYNDTANALYFYNGSAWTLIASASGNSLDGAYGLGSKIDVDATVLELEVDDNSNNAALLLDMDDATNNPDVLQITSDSTGDLISLNGSTTGNLIYDENGNFTVSSAGALSAATITATTDLTMTGTNYNIVWDSSEDTLEVLDNSVVALGTGDDVTVTWNASNLLIESAAEDTGEIQVGATNAIDLVLYANTNTSEVAFNANTATAEFNGYDIQVMSDDKVAFGDSDEFVIEYDDDGDDDLVIVAGTANDQVLIGDETTGTDFVMVSSAGTAATHAAWFDASGNTNQGIFKFGNDDHGLDVEFYGETASQLVTWDQSADTWYFGTNGEGVDVSWYGDTADDNILFDESGDEVVFTDIDLTGTGLETFTGFKVKTEVVAGTTDTLTAAQSGQTLIYTQTGGACTVTLPEATEAAIGVWYWLIDGNTGAGNDLKIDPEGDGTINGASAGNYVENQTDADGCACYIVCTAADTWYTVYTPSAWAEE